MKAAQCRTWLKKQGYTEPQTKQLLSFLYERVDESFRSGYFLRDSEKKEGV